MRLNGWMRIAIVASIVWMVGGTFYQMEKEARSLQAYSDAVMQQQLDCVVRSSQQEARSQRQETCETYGQALDRSFALKPRPIEWLAFGPAILLVLAWLLGGITVLAVWWIRRGFRPS